MRESGVFKMKTSRIILGICGIAAGVAVVLTGVWFISNAGNPTMDRTEALQYALADADLDESEITITKQNLERDDGKNYYEIEFYSAAYAYEYEIDARNGAVLDVSIEALFDRPNTDVAQGNGAAVQPQPSGEAPSVPDTPSAPDTQITPEVPAAQDGRIGVDTAKAAALADAGFTEADVVFTKTELDRDDGVEEYDIEFYVGSTEYEYEINAATGAIISRDIDYDSDDYGGYRGSHDSHHAHHCWHK